MARFLANENAPREAVLAARDAGHDVSWMVELQPGASDEVVLALAQREDRVLVKAPAYRLRRASNGSRRWSI